MKQKLPGLIFGLIFAIIWTIIACSIVFSFGTLNSAAGLFTILFPIVGIIMTISIIIQIVKTVREKNSSSSHTLDNPQPIAYKEHSLSEKVLQSDSIYIQNDNAPTNGKGQRTNAIATLIFSIFWLAITLSMTIAFILSGSSGFSFLIPCLFVVVGIVIMTTSIKQLAKKKQADDKPKNQHANETAPKNTPVEDEYFVKYCIGCGNSLKKAQKFCPYCGKEVK